MKHDDFADLVSPQIRNAPIVHELDKARQRELRGALVLAVPLVAVVLFSVWQHFELLQYGYRIEQLRQEYSRQQELNRHLRLEIAALRSPARIERVATAQLRMVMPAGDDERVLERVLDAPAADQPVVAMRQEVSSEPTGESN
ncbi:MAG: cell division protein FtsL [Rhodospirillaceae bacterium]|nr:cell division protein FtsL [Rhodospirillaceae bacterium]